MLKGNNTKYKQILIDRYNFNALKELERTRDSFNEVIRKLLNKFKDEGVKA